MELFYRGFRDPPIHEYLLRRAGVLDLAHGGAKHQVEMPLHHVGKGGLLAGAGEALEPLKILTPFVHL